MNTKSISFLDLCGHTALISGASGGIGKSIALMLAKTGARTVLHAHKNTGAAQALAEEISDRGGKALVLSCDLSAPKAAQELVDKARAADFAPDILVNNAARQDVLALNDLSLTDWRAMFAATLDSAFALTQAVCASLIADEKSGTIVNIASIEGLAPATGHAHYASAKAALLQFTRAAALEYGPSGIRVNAVSPGLIDRTGLGEDWPEGVARWKASAPLGRLGQPDDVAKAVLYLASPMSNWVSGSNLVVDGGMLSGPNW